MGEKLRNLNFSPQVEATEKAEAKKASKFRELLSVNRGLRSRVRENQDLLGRGQAEVHISG